MYYKILLGYLAVLIALISYIPYFRDIFKGKTKPHAFTWFVWGLITGIAFAAQIVEKGGAGAWVTGATSIICFAIFVLALIKGDRNFIRFDWFSLGAALLALFLWWLTNEPLVAVVLIVLTDAFAFLPTFRKAFFKPHEETLSTFALSVLKFGIALFALETYTLVTWLYPAFLVFQNSLFVVMLIWRRKVLGDSKGVSPL